MRIKYVGPSPAVDIAPGYHAEHGKPFDVPDELGANLCAGDTFTVVKKFEVAKSTATPEATPAEADADAEPKEAE